MVKVVQAVPEHIIFCTMFLLFCAFARIGKYNVYMHIYLFFILFEFVLYKNIVYLH